MLKDLEIAVGKELHESLCAYEGAFRVRLVFDEVGSLGEVVRALCGQGSAVFHELLRWGPEVSVHVVAGGTGVGAVDTLSGSQLANYHLTRLEPQSTGVLWERMKEGVTSKAIARGARFHTALVSVLDQVSNDVVGKSASCNPRLAALMIVRCWNVTTVAGNWHHVQPISSWDIRCRILVPAAERYRSLNGLSSVAGHAELRELLVSALCYALFPLYNDPSLSRGHHFLTQRYGVLVDNTYFKEKSSIDPDRETIALDGAGREVENPGTSQVACYPTAKGRYSISPAMVAVLYLLLVGNSAQLMRCEGDTFEAALAHMLYIAVQVYQGRPVVELLRFVFGEDAVSSSMTTSLEGKAVTYEGLELRHNGTPLNMAAVVRLLRNGDGSPKYPEAVAEAEAAGGNVTRKQQRRIANAEQEAKNQLPLYDELWSTCEGGAAWVEVSPAALPSAGVVLHIPGVLTLPVVCRDVVESLPDDEVVHEVDKMMHQPQQPTPESKERGNEQRGNHQLGNQERGDRQCKDQRWGAQQQRNEGDQSSTVTATHVELSNRLAMLGGDVVPVLCFSRHVLAEERAEGESVVCSCCHAIIADGLGEDVAKETDPRRQRLYDTRLVRRSMFPFTLQELPIDGGVTLVDACPVRSPK